jgi:uncharacterized surface protein with fasciclin (FAS1) repeats
MNASPTVSTSPIHTVSPAQNLADTFAGKDSLKTFNKAILAADLRDYFTGAGPYTVFAPTEAAFSKLPAGKLDEWLKPENKSSLIGMLKNHVTPGRVSADAVGKLDQAKSVNGQIVMVKTTGGKVTLDNASITTPDVSSSNGVIHLIDEVLGTSRS